MDFQFSDEVKRIGSDKDYATGRTGLVLEIGHANRHGKVRVNWFFERDGTPVRLGNKVAVNGIRTWVDSKTLVLVHRLVDKK